MNTPRQQDGSISVVVPLLNEAAVLPSFLGELRDVLDQTGHAYEIILVDDGSRDNTWQLVTDVAARESCVQGLRLSRNFGKDAAIFAGLSESSGDAVVVMDGDLQHPPAVVLRLIERWQEGAQVVEGVKSSRTDQPMRVRIGARAFNHAFLRLTGVDLTEATDLRLLSREALDALLALPERTVFFRGTSSWIGFSRAQVHFDVDPRPIGRSRFGLRSLARFGVRSLTSFTSTPLHLVTVLGVVFAMFSAMLGAQTLVAWLRGHAVEGFTTVILLLLLQGSAILIGLGIIGEYLARIHDEVKGRPRFIVAGRTGALDEELT